MPSEIELSREWRSLQNCVKAGKIGTSEHKEQKSVLSTEFYINRFSFRDVVFSMTATLLRNSTFLFENIVIVRQEIVCSKTISNMCENVRSVSFINAKFLANKALYAKLDFVKWIAIYQYLFMVMLLKPSLVIKIWKLW